MTTLSAHAPCCRCAAQVLVSIQGLVLVPLPYFNEAGYEKQARLSPHMGHAPACVQRRAVHGTCHHGNARAFPRRELAGMGHPAGAPRRRAQAS